MFVFPLFVVGFFLLFFSFTSRSGRNWLSTSGNKVFLSQAKVLNSTITSNWFLRLSEPPTINLLLGDPCWRGFPYKLSGSGGGATDKQRKNNDKRRKSSSFLHLFIYSTATYCSITTFAKQCLVSIISFQLLIIATALSPLPYFSCWCLSAPVFIDGSSPSCCEL